MLGEPPQAIAERFRVGRAWKDFYREDARIVP
jgi:hypothetical protein